MASSSSQNHMQNNLWTFGRTSSVERLLRLAAAWGFVIHYARWRQDAPQDNHQGDLRSRRVGIVNDVLRDFVHIGLTPQRASTMEALNKTANTIKILRVKCMMLTENLVVARRRLGVCVMIKKCKPEVSLNE